MVTDKMKELEAVRAKLVELEALVIKARDKEFAALPARYGYPDAASFIAAVKAATGGGKKRRGRKRKSGAAPAGTKRRTRARITEEMRADVKKMAQAGRTGAEIAKAVGISLPSVQNIKKAAGLVKNRKK